MPCIPFDQMPDDGRLWVFGSERPLSGDEEGTVLEAVDGFLGAWRAHGQPLTNARLWQEGSFLLVAVDEATVPPSGCSIDAMVRILKGLEAELGVGLAGHGRIWYRDPEGRVSSADRGAFRELVDRGDVDGETPVFDVTLTRVRQFREGRLEVPARSSWHARAFPLEAAS